MSIAVGGLLAEVSNFGPATIIPRYERALVPLHERGLIKIKDEEDLRWGMFSVVVSELTRPSVVPIIPPDPK
jgi:hypothetical protein